MTLGGILEEATGSLRADRRQSSLALAGVVCGVAAIMTALAIGEGARREALAEVEGLGIDNVLVRAAASRDRRGLAGPALTIADARAIAQTVANASAVAALRSIRLPLVMERQTIAITTLGVTPDWIRVTPAALRAGRWLTAAEMSERRRVVVLGAGLAARLFDDGEAIGRLVKLGDQWYGVVGVLAARSDPTVRATAVSRVDLQEAAILPLTALDPRAADGSRGVDEVAVRARTAEGVSAVAAAIRTALARRLPADAVEIIVPRELVAARMRARKTFDAVLIAVGGLVLGISGLGIMNVMLAGVARRTVEIGVRRAVGARSHDILGQFVAEAVLLCAAGGVVGVPAGVVLSLLAGALAGWSTSISAAAIALAIGAASAVGLACGAYPARVAAALTPCDALRGD